MRQNLKYYLLFTVLLVGVVTGRPASAPEEMMHYVIPAHRLDDTFSSNWVAQVRSVLPSKFSKKSGLTFETVTNLLSHESAHGNYKAAGLLGFTKIICSNTKEGVDEGMELMQESADKGYVTAMINLGMIFSQGKYVRKDYGQAFHWYAMAAENGNVEAELELGGCYQYGLGVAPNLTMAAKYYRLAAEKTNYVAMKSLGYVLSSGPESSRDLPAAKYWTERAATEGDNARAMYNMGVFAMNNSSGPEACDLAFQWYKRGAEKNDALAAWQLANFYLNGKGTDTNLTSYRFWRFKAAALGSTEAQYAMCVAYRNGDGLPVDEVNSWIWCAKAAAKNHPASLYDMYVRYAPDTTNQPVVMLANDCLARAARAGHAEAQFLYALACFKGERFSQDCEAGKTWLQKSADDNWNRAEFFLYTLYNGGFSPAAGCPAYPKDKAKSIDWLRRAAEHGNLEAQSILAVSLIQGVDMAQNKPEAEKFLRGAANHGFGRAQNDLGFAILHGDCNATNPVEAAMWCKLATDNITDPKLLQRARVNFDHAVSLLTPSQQAEAIQQANMFKPVPPPPVQPLEAGWETNSDYQTEDGEFGH